MEEYAYLSNQGSFTQFSYKHHRVRFRTSPALQKYLKVLEWDQGYLVVLAQYDTGIEEEYIDLVPILENLYFDSKEFLKSIKGVIIE